MSETLAEILYSAAGRWKDKTALRYKREGEYTSLSFGSCCEVITDYAYGLSRFGIERGDTVAILSENRPEWVFTDMAVLSLGGVTVPVYGTLSPKQIEYVLNDSHCKAIAVSQPEHLKLIGMIFNDLKYLKKIVTFFPGHNDFMTITKSFQQVVDTGAEARTEDPGFLKTMHEKADGTDIATIIYTSGTTGTPKGVMLSHDNIIANIKGVTNVLEVSENDVFLSFLPLSHIFERMGGYYFPLYVGAAIAYAESTDTVKENMQEIRPTVITSVPRLYEKMYAVVQDTAARGSFLKKLIFRWCVHTGKVYYYWKQTGKVSKFLAYRYSMADMLVFKKLRDKTGGNLRFFVSGGAPLSQEIAKFFAYAGIYILEGYGLTETSPVISINLPENIKIGTVGKPLPNVEVRIAEDGEICTRGPNIMKGYFNKPEETKEVIDEKGWLHTGDIGFIDEEGRITITDRKKNLIVTSGGKNIAPQPIENLLITSRYIDQIMMIGDKRQFLSALIVPAFEYLETYFKANGLTAGSRKELVKHSGTYKLISSEIKRLSTDLSNYECIQKFDVLDREFTEEDGVLTPTLKIIRKAVEKKYAREIGKLYS